MLNKKRRKNNNSLKLNSKKKNKTSRKVYSQRNLMYGKGSIEELEIERDSIDRLIEEKKKKELTDNKDRLLKELEEKLRLLGREKKLELIDRIKKYIDKVETDNLNQKENNHQSSVQSNDSSLNTELSLPSINKNISENNQLQQQEDLVQSSLDVPKLDQDDSESYSSKVEEGQPDDKDIEPEMMIPDAESSDGEEGQVDDKDIRSKKMKLKSDSSDDEEEQPDDDEEQPDDEDVEGKMVKPEVEPSDDEEEQTGDQGKMMKPEGESSDDEEEQHDDDEEQPDVEDVEGKMGKPEVESSDDEEEQPGDEDKMMKSKSELSDDEEEQPDTEPKMMKSKSESSDDEEEQSEAEPKIMKPERKSSDEEQEQSEAKPKIMKSERESSHDEQEQQDEEDIESKMMKPAIEPLDDEEEQTDDDVGEYSNQESEIKNKEKLSDSLLNNEYFYKISDNNFVKCYVNMNDDSENLFIKNLLILYVDIKFVSNNSPSQLEKDKILNINSLELYDWKSEWNNILKFSFLNGQTYINLSDINFQNDKKTLIDPNTLGVITKYGLMKDDKKEGTREYKNYFIIIDNIEKNKIKSKEYIEKQSNIKRELLLSIKDNRQIKELDTNLEEIQIKKLKMGDKVFCTDRDDFEGTIKKISRDSKNNLIITVVGNGEIECKHVEKIS